MILLYYIKHQKTHKILQFDNNNKNNKISQNTI